MPTAVVVCSATGQPLSRSGPLQRRSFSQQNTTSAVQRVSLSELTSRIKHASPSELLHLHTSHQQVLDDVHVSAFLNRLVYSSGSTGTTGQHNKRLQQPRQHAGVQQYQEQQLLLALLADVQQLMPSLRPRAAASIFWALAKMQKAHVQTELLQQLLQHMHQQLGFQQFEPRQLCIVAYALVQLQSQGVVGSRNACNTRHAQHHVQYSPGLLDDLYAALGRNLQLCSAHDVAQAVYTLAQLKHAPPAGWLEAWLRRAQQVLPQFTAQGLANAAYGLATVLRYAGQLSHGCSSSSSGSSANSSDSGIRSHGSSTRHSTASDRHVDGPVSNTQQQVLTAARAWLQNCMRTAVLHLPLLQPGELYGQLLWASSKLNCPLPEPAGHHILARAEALLPQCDAQHLAFALYCFARLQLQPSPQWLRTYWKSAQQQLRHFKPIDLSQLLWAAAALQLEVPLRLESKICAAVCNMFPASVNRRVHPGLMASAVRSLVALDLQLDERQWLRFQGSVAAQMHRFKAREYADVLQALGAGKRQVDSRWMECLLMSAQRQLPYFSPEHMSTTLWALARLQHTPARQWMVQFLSSSLPQLPAFTPLHHCHMIWALAELHITPSPLWLSTFWSTSGQTLNNFTAEQLVTTATAVAKLQLQPPAAWIQGLTRAVHHNMGQFESNTLLEVLQAIQKLHPSAVTNGPRLTAVQGDNGRTVRYIWSSSIVPFRRQHHQFIGIRNSSVQAVRGGRRVCERHSPNTMQPERPLDKHTEKSSVATMLGFSSSATDFGSHRLPRQHMQEQQPACSVAVLQQLDAVAAEAYSMACLVVLMPDWLQQKVADWPKHLAAERAAHLPQHSRSGAAQPGRPSLQRSLVASVS